MTSMIAPVAPESEAILDSFYEVVRGQIREKPLMGTWENWIANVLGRHLDNFVSQHELGTVILENLFLLDRVANLQRRPDIAFVSRQRWLGLPAKSNAWEVVPDLAVEVTSPTNKADEVMAKIEEYFRVGVRRVWVVYCEQRKVYAYTSPRHVAILEPADELGGGDVIPGFRLSLAKLFDEGETVSSPSQP